MIKKLNTIVKITILSLLFLGLISANALALQRPVENNERVDVLISFYEMPGAAEQNLVHNFGGKINRDYNNFPVIAANIPEKALLGLSNQSSVRSVELDNEVYAVGYSAEAEYGNSWGVTHIGANLAHDGGYLGESIKVAIIDSGVDYTHRDLALNFVGVDLGYDFVENDNDPMDVYGHGTHVAGTVAAIIDDFGVVGVAPKAQLISLRILNDDGIGSESNTLAALDWILTYNNDNKNNPIRITNNSYGRGSSSSPLKDAFDKLEAAGVLSVAAAGNSGNPAGKNDSIIYPAKYSSVMAIGAVDKYNNRPSWSSTGPDLELVAPGVSVLSTWNSDTSSIGTNPICFEDDAGKCHYYKEGSGTSMASPHVAGTAALAWAIDLNLTNTEIRSHLQKTAEYLGDPNQYGYGLVHADRVSEIEPLATGNVEGTVKGEDDVAITGATVVVEGTNLSTTTDAGGYYLLENVSVGDQQLTASAKGYYSQKVTVTVVEGATVTQDFVLQAIPTYTVSGTVKDTEGTLEGATVTIEETGQSVITDNGGAYAISDVEKGTYKITASKSGYSSQTKTITIEGNMIVDFVLEEVTEVVQKMYINSIEMWYKAVGPNRFVYTKIEIVSSDGASVSGSTVYLKMTLPDGSTASGSGNTANDGTITFELKSRQTGTYTSEVTDVVKDGWVYDSPSNVKISESLEVK